MAEVKEENERSIYKSNLERIVEELVRRSKELPFSSVQFKEARSIGIMEYKRKESFKAQKLYSISMVADGTMFAFIIGEDGDRIATVKEREDKEEENGRRTVAQTVTIETDEGIEIDKERLEQNIQLSSDAQNDNQGRHITDREEKTMTEGERKQQENNIENNIQLRNLSEDVSVDKDVAIIDLYRTIYNGRRFRDVLAIDSKLKDRVPAGANIEHLNFLTVVNSAELTEKDGIARESTVTAVIMDDPRNPKYMIELDSSILKPRADLSKQENITADKTSERVGDGEIKKGASATTNTRQITTFEIPDAGSDISQSNDMLTLEIRQNPKYIDESTSQRNDAHNIEFYLGVQDRAKDQNEQQHGLNTKSIKLEAYDETTRIDETRMRDEFRTDRGPDDENYNILGVTSGEEKEVPERDANDLNSQLKTEQEINDSASTKQSEGAEALNGAVANVVNERQHYMEMAKSMDIDGYGPNEICDRLMAEKQKNPDLTDGELQNTVKEQLTWERVPGPNTRRF